MTEYQYHYRKRKALGICTHCGKNDAEPGHVECKKCRVKHNLREQKRRDSDREAFREHAWERMCQRKAEARENGLCSRCCNVPADKGYKTCWRCRMNSRRVKTYAMSDEQKRRKAELTKARRQKLVEEHICVRCGKRPAREKFKDCGICAAKVNRRRRELKHQRGQSIPAYMRGDGTYCKMCCKPKCNGEKLCDECRDKARKSIAIANEANSIHGGWGTLDFRKIKYEVKST